MYPGGCEVLGVCHVKDRKDSEFGHSEPLSFPNKSCFWVPHGGLGLLLSEVFLKQRWRVFVKNINEEIPSIMVPMSYHRSHLHIM